MTRTTASQAGVPGFTPGEPTVYHGRAEFAAVTRALRGTGRRIALVPTMGALHAGHRALIDAARRTPGTVVAVSIFVNPLQFGANEDLSAYPRTLDADLKVCAEAGAELVFAPSAEEMYPNGAPGVTVVPGALGDVLEGASRPGHFAGMLTVVAKLLGIARPDYAFFGEKDYQQLVLVTRMSADLDMGTRIVGVPTVREPDGLALSSRNAYLDAAQRESAVALSAALAAGVAAGQRGGDPLPAAREVLAAAAGIEPDYLELRGPDLGPPPGSGAARLLVAARAGTTRLIDNAAVELPGEGS